MYTALRATSQTLTRFLEARFQSDALLSTSFGAGGMVVSLNTPQEMTEKPAEGLSVWLYRVMRDEQRLNDPPARLSPTQSRPAPLPLHLHYLMTPVTDRKLGDPETEQLILGKVLQTFHSHSVWRGADLQAELTGTDADLKIRLEPMSLEEITRVWEGLEGSYQLSLRASMKTASATCSRPRVAATSFVSVNSEICRTSTRTAEKQEIAVGVFDFETTQTVVSVFQRCEKLYVARRKFGRQCVRIRNAQERIPARDALFDISCVVRHGSNADGFHQDLRPAPANDAEENVVRFGPLEGDLKSEPVAIERQRGGHVVNDKER